MTRKPECKNKPRGYREKALDEFDSSSHTGVRLSVSCQEQLAA